MKNLFIGFVLFGIVLIGIGICNRTEETIVVTRTEMQQNISSDNHNRTTSTTVFMVYSDKGVYEVSQEGLFAHPEYVGRIHEGDTLNIETAMFDAPILGLYKTIVEIK